MLSLKPNVRTCALQGFWGIRQGIKASYHEKLHRSMPIQTEEASKNSS